MDLQGGCHGLANGGILDLDIGFVQHSHKVAMEHCELPVVDDNDGIAVPIGQDRER